jgi:hypothetical protein
MHTCTGWARDGRPRAPQFGFLFFPPSFSCSFPFPFVVSFSLSFLFLFSRVFFGCLSLLTVLSFRLLPRSPPLVSVPRCIHSPCVRLARWQQRGHIAPPLFTVMKRVASLAASSLGFFFSFSFFFSFCLWYVFSSLFSCARADALPPSLPGARRPPLARKCGWGVDPFSSLIHLVRPRLPLSLVVFVCLVAFVCPACASLAGDKEGRLSPAASGLGFSRLSRAFIFVSGSSFSHFSRVPADVLPPLPGVRWPPLACKHDLGVNSFSPLRLSLPPFAPIPCHIRSPCVCLGCWRRRGRLARSPSHPRLPG